MDWNIFRRALKVTANQSFTKEDTNEKALKLLLDGKITIFNIRRGDFQFLNLSEAYLTEANLRGADLSEANLPDSTIIKPIEYDRLIINQNTNFNHGITDDSAFIYYISQFTENVPEKIKDKNELKIKLKEKRRISEDVIEKLLKNSQLPD